MFAVQTLVYAVLSYNNSFIHRTPNVDVKPEITDMFKYILGTLPEEYRVPHLCSPTILNAVV